jgi:hypothetical protein
MGSQATLLLLEIQSPHTCTMKPMSLFSLERTAINTTDEDQIWDALQKVVS